MATSEFPFAGLLPKIETHADKFLENNQSFDGRLTKVAVFDTGVDPGAVGLQKTTQGAPKILDLIDCTGSGDVKLSPVPPESVILNLDNTFYELQGLSGRKLEIPTSWVKTEGTWQLGLKRVYELWPKDLVSRIRAERKKLFMQTHHKYETEVQTAYSKLEVLMEPDSDQRLMKSDLEAQIKALKSMQDQYEDLGPVYDCIVFKPKTETALQETSPNTLPWAVIDTTEGKDMSSLSPMHAYCHSQQFGVFSDASLMSYSFNFYDEDILSINVVSGTHGTHVAGIIAAHHPANRALDGIAPGAQIISMKIGDTRLGSMETSQSFMRAMNAAINLGVDIINISYGEDSHIANDGPLMAYMRDKVIRKHKITVVSSAGNSGPGYSTIGAPGGMCSSIISVGAYVSKSMAAAQYALRGSAGDSTYTWSSRGPSIDGDRGVTILAPGGAITCVPPYALNQSQLMNGTSMSSPNAAGGIALLISGLKAKGHAYSPGSIKRALERTSQDVSDEFQVGLLDVPQAFEDLLAGESCHEDMYFDIKVDNTMRGIIMRNIEDFDSAKVFNVEIKPYFDEKDTQHKFDFELYLSLESDNKIIEMPKFVHLNNTGRLLQVKVDPSSLKPGLHISSIRAISNTSKKCLFEIPVCIAKPSRFVSKHLDLKMKFTAGKIERHFLEIPAGVSGLTIRTSSQNITTPVQLWIAKTQFQPDTRRTWTSEPFVQNLSSSEGAMHASKTISTVEGTLELSFAQFWSSLADQAAEISINIEYHGLKASYGDKLYIEGGTGYKQVLVKSYIGQEDFKPKVNLKMTRKQLRSISSKITALRSRDLLEDQATHLYAITLQYTVTPSRACEGQIVLPMSGTLYENPWFSSLIQVFDENKNLVHFGSTYPEKQKYEKRTYTIIVELVHPDRSVLETMKDQKINFDMSFEKDLSLDLYENFLKVWGGPKAEFKNIKMSKGQTKSFSISTSFEAPKDVTYGDLLLGEITLGSQKELKCPVIVSVPPPANVKKEKETPKTTVELQIELGSKISDKDEKHKYFDDLSKAHPKDLKVLKAHLENCIEDNKEYIANSIIDLIDASVLAQYFGTTHPATDEQDEAQKAEAKDFALQKEVLAKAYSIKIEKTPSQEVFDEFLKWTDGKSVSSLVVQARGYADRELYGRALSKYFEAVKTEDLNGEEEKTARTVLSRSLKALKLDAWLAKVESDRIGRDPSEFRGF